MPGLFVIEPTFQRLQYGRESADGLLGELTALDEYQSVRCEVYLQNWPALRFWIQRGFRSIVAWDGARVIASDAFASLILERRLGGGAEVGA